MNCSASVAPRAATGNDTLVGGDGADTYLFNRGDGQDTVNDGGWDAIDTVVLGAGITPGDVTVTQGDGGRDLVLTFAGSPGDRLVLDDRIVNGWAGADVVRFADGTVWDYAELLCRSLAPTAGNDTLYGDEGANTLAGGAGNDFLQGRNGADTYLFNRGDGDDIIFDGGWDGAIDTVVLGAGITPGEVTVTQGDGGRDLALTFAGNATDRVVLDDRLTNGWAGADAVRFADGTVWDYAELLRRSLAPTAGNDTLYGDEGANTLAGGAGNDFLQGRNGADTYLFNRGDGQDTIHDGGWDAIDTVVLGAGITPGDVTVTQGDGGRDLALTFAGNATDRVVLDDRLTNGWAGADAVRFADGTVWDYAAMQARIVVGLQIGGSNADTLVGGAGNDTLVGGAGADTLTGGAGADVFRFQAVADSTPAVRDVITDFAAAQGDLIDLAPIDANLGQAGDQAFAWLGVGTAFGGVAGQLRGVVLGSDLELQADLDGNGQADFAVLLRGVTTLSANAVLL